MLLKTDHGNIAMSRMCSLRKVICAIFLNLVSSRQTFRNILLAERRFLLNSIRPEISQHALISRSPLVLSQAL